jgi:hypothetical protein
MPFDVTMPDGTTVKGVPDGTTKSQLMARYSKTAPAQTPPQPEDKGAMPSFGNIKKYAVENMQSAAKTYGEAEKEAQSGPSLSVAAKASLGLLSGAMSGVNAVSKSVIGDPITKLTGSRMAGDVAEFAAPFASGAVRKAANVLTGSLAGDIAKGALGKSVPGLEKTSSALWAKANGTIEAAKGSGLKLAPIVEEDLKNKVAGMERLSTAGDKANAKQTVDLLHGKGGLLDSISPQEIKSASGEKDLIPGDHSLRNLLGFRKKFDAIANGKLGDDSLAAREVSERIDKVISEHLQKGQITGGDLSAAQNLPAFKSQWTAYKNHETLTKLLADNKGNYKDMQKALMKVRDGKYFSTFPPEAQEFIKRGASGKISGGLLNALGVGVRILGNKSAWGRIGNVGEAAALALHPGAIVPALGIAGASGLANAGGKAIMKGTIQDALSAISKGAERDIPRAKLPPPGAPPAPGPMGLPKPPPPRPLTPPAPKVAMPGAPAGKQYLEKSDIPKATDPHHVAMEHVIEQGKKTGHEHAVMITGSGEVLHRTSGAKNYVSFTGDDIHLMDNPNSNIVLHHNHPDGGALSSADLGVLAASRGVKEIIAHTHDLGSSAAKFTPEAKNFFKSTTGSEAEKIMGRVYNKAVAPLQIKYGRAVNLHQMTGVEASRAMQEEVLGALHRAGLIDYSSSMKIKRLPDNAEDVSIPAYVKALLKKEGFTNDREIKNVDRYTPARHSDAGKERGVYKKPHPHADGATGGESSVGMDAGVPPSGISKFLSGVR